MPLAAPTQCPTRGDERRLLECRHRAPTENRGLFHNYPERLINLRVEGIVLALQLDKGNFHSGVQRNSRSMRAGLPA